MSQTIRGEETPPSFKVAIVGGAPSSKHLAPFNDPEWQIWGLAFRTVDLPRFDALFEIHEKRDYVKESYYTWLHSLKQEVVAARGFPAAPNVTIFPFDKIPPEMGLYLTSSIAYMMALAIIRGASEIALYGCDMAVDDDEYFRQRPCLEQWIGYAKGKGIKVTIPAQSPIGKSSYVYGMEDHNKGGPFTEEQFMGLAKQHQKAMDEIDAQMRQMQSIWKTHDGARQAFERMAKAARAVHAGMDIKSLDDTVLVKT